MNAYKCFIKGFDKTNAEYSIKNLNLNGNYYSISFRKPYKFSSVKSIEYKIMGENMRDHEIISQQ